MTTPLIDLTSPIEALVNRGMAQAHAETRNRPATIELNGRKFIYDDEAKHYREIGYHEEHNAPTVPEVQLNDWRSVVEWCRRCNDEFGESGEILPQGEVCISRSVGSGVVIPRFANKFQKRNTATKRFFAEYLPPTGPMTYASFRGWLDNLGERIDQYDAVCAALASVSAMTGSGLKIRTTGAVMRFETRDERGVETQGVLPRLLTARMPFGDPDFECPVQILVTAQVENQQVRFWATHRTADRAHDAYVEWSRNMLSEAEEDGGLPENYALLVVP